MTPTQLRAILEQVRAGATTIDAAVGQLDEATVAELGYATLDLQRKDRCGFPEVVFAEGKTEEWVEGAIRRLSAAAQDCFVTRLNSSQSDHLAKTFLRRTRSPRTFYFPCLVTAVPVGRVHVTAGTATYGRRSAYCEAMGSGRTDYRCRRGGDSSRAAPARSSCRGRCRRRCGWDGWRTAECRRRTGRLPGDRLPDERGLWRLIWRSCGSLDDAE